MLHTLQQMLAPAVMERVTLLANHIIAAEPAARTRLLPHAGKRLRVVLQGWPALLPPAPALVWQVTPAGLLEWSAEPLGVELEVKVVADNPALLMARLAAGERPTVEISGDAALAADVDWLAQNLRWDVPADLERVLPAPLVAALASAGKLLAQGLRAAVERLNARRPGPA